MSSPRNPDYLYDLLPAFIRFRDAYEGWPLRSLMRVLDIPRWTIAQDLARLYANWFIETCEEWVVPYIGDLCGVRGLAEVHEVTSFSRRAQVANAISHRRRKGVPSTLAQVVRDGTGWYACVEQYRDRLARTQALQSLRTRQCGTVNLRDTATLALLDGPLSRIARTADLGRPNHGPGDPPVFLARRGRCNLPNLGLFLWRLQSYPVVFGRARRVRPGGYTFSPFGIDQPLFHTPRTSGRPAGPDELVDAPAPLQPQQLAADLAARRHGRRDAFPRQDVAVFVAEASGDTLREIPPERLGVRDLTGWPDFPAGGREQLQAAVDPVLGRLLLSHDDPQREVRVCYAYGFSSDLGGGPYQRQLAVPPQEGLWQAFVSHDLRGLALAGGEGAPPLFATLGEALQAWPETSPWGAVYLLDSAAYDVEGLRLDLRGRRGLTFQAASGQCPCLTGGVTVLGTGTGDCPVLTLDGLWIDGRIAVQGDLHLHVTHCTLKPPAAGAAGPLERASLRAEGLRQAEVILEWSIAGPLHLPPEAQLSVRDSILEGGAGFALRGSTMDDGDRSPGPTALLERTTVFGRVSVSQLTAEGVLFTEPVQADDVDDGAVRLSYVPDGSRTPRREGCKSNAVAPIFTSARFGDPGYAQLGPRIPAEIFTGGRDGGEMGAFHHLYQPQRLGSLPAILEEYVPWGLEARVQFAT